MKTKLSRWILNHGRRLAMPIGVYAGLEMIQATVKDAISNAAIQTSAVFALHEHFKTPIMLTAMDLSAEAETFGCEIRLSEDEIPTVLGRRVSTRKEIDTLPDPQPGDFRTQVHLDTAHSLVSHSDGALVLGGCIGPFSLAGRLFGVSEIMELTINDEEATLALLVKATRFLTRYALAFRETGATGVIMAEPAAGLLSPRALGKFSSPFIHQIIDASQNENFSVVYHNCGAKLPHLPKILEAGAEMYHFGEPMNLLSALDQVGGKAILAGNLDPTAVFYNGKPEQVREQTRQLLETTTSYPNYVISSGCDLPPGTSLANLESFYATVTEYNE